MKYNYLVEIYIYIFDIYIYTHTHTYIYILSMNNTNLYLKDTNYIIETYASILNAHNFY